MAELPIHQSTRGQALRSATIALISAIVSSASSSLNRKRWTFVNVGPMKMQ